MLKHHDYQKYIAVSLIVILLIFIVNALLPYINAFFGAFILFLIFYKFYDFLVAKFRLREGFAAAIVITTSTLFVIVPLSFLTWTSFLKIHDFLQGKEFSAAQFSSAIESIDALIPGVSLRPQLESMISSLVEYLRDFLLGALHSVSEIVITLVIMYFLFYYLLIKNKDAKQAIQNLIPFNNKNSEKLLESFKEVTYSTLITSGLIAVLQGMLIGLGFWMLGIEGAFFWGVLSAFLSFVPVLGISLVWIPGLLIFLAQENYFVSIGIIVLGLAASNIDNFIRPYIQKKVARIHPLITLIGIFIGLPYFGLLGLIIGPLLLIYLILTIQMFKEEYVKQ